MTVQWLRGNALTLLENGTCFFPTLVEEINRATTEIFLETYIFASDDIGRTVSEALQRAARRGVTVRLIVDGFGGRDFVAHLMEPLTEAGVHVLIYRREVATLSLRRHRLRRLHRKLAVIDGRVAFVGGINIISDYEAPALDAPRQDYTVRIEGPLLAPIHSSAWHVWGLVSWASFRRRLRLLGKVHPQALPVGDTEAAFVIRDNIRHRRDIEDAYLLGIAAARREIILANAYFLPGRRFRQALLAAARRGVRITLLVQGLADHPLQQLATRAIYDSLLSAGIRIIEYHRSYLHAKVAVIDEHWATVGSSNIDPFSLLLAREANVVIRHSPFAATLRDSLLQAIARGGREIHADAWQRAPLSQRLINWTAYGLVRLMIGIAGYGNRH
ncbi:cardiolipin synthase ClsB [Zoogloea dura]|uniref:Cardiolipin synthase B n=1 Tax=Zoogloea dura TaxID=2728840 RepID=A0A848G8V5_9RHOO|nr:cardiolipin synthase ClsB [Zoogloea dura]NML27750.1 cardiolipin synthase ClsB [Zoogloea dura]